jgi:vesicle coat complex subunit
MATTSPWKTAPKRDEQLQNMPKFEDARDEQLQNMPKYAKILRQLSKNANSKTSTTLGNTEASSSKTSDI